MEIAADIIKYQVFKIITCAIGWTKEKVFDFFFDLRHALFIDSNLIFIDLGLNKF